jgi:RNA-binding protein
MRLVRAEKEIWLLKPEHDGSVNIGGRASMQKLIEVSPDPQLWHPAGMSELTNATIRGLKARGQLLKPVLKVGKDGLSPQFLAQVVETLKHRELIKVKFESFKEQKQELAPLLAEKSGSELIMRVGNVVLLYRPKPAAEPASEGPVAE